MLTFKVCGLLSLQLNTKFAFPTACNGLRALIDRISGFLQTGMSGRSPTFILQCLSAGTSLLYREHDMQTSFLLDLLSTPQLPPAMSEKKTLTVSYTTWCFCSRSTEPRLALKRSGIDLLVMPTWYVFMACEPSRQICWVGAV